MEKGFCKDCVWCDICNEVKDKVCYEDVDYEEYYRQEFREEFFKYLGYHSDEFWYLDPQ